MKRLQPDTAEQGFARRLLLVILAVALTVFLYRIADLLLLVFGATLGAILLSSVADWMVRHSPLSRPWAVAIATAAMLVILGLMGWLFGSETIRQAAELGRKLPGDWARLQSELAAHPIGKAVVDSLHRGVESSQLSARLLRAGWGATEIGLNFIIVLVGSIFFAAQPKIYRRGLILLAPAPYREVAADTLDDLVRSLRLWLWTQLVSMVLMGVMIGFGLWLSGIEAPAALGLLGGLSEFIPYVGPTLAMIPAVIVALTGPGSLVGVLVTYAVVRLVQANLITPLISQQLVSVPPGLYLFLILACGYAFGLFGMFFSGALSVTAYTLAIRLYARETLGDRICLPGEKPAETD